jgi:hypothetical protein
MIGAGGKVSGIKTAYQTTGHESNVWRLDKDKVQPPFYVCDNARVVSVDDGAMGVN